MIFADRAEAGRSLAWRLEKYANRNDVIVLGIPRGGVPVAFEVAEALRAPLDVFLLRKLGVPGQEELAFGAIASGGVRVLDPQILRTLSISSREVDSITIRRAQVVVETYEGALAEAGDLLIPMSEGLITHEEVRADLHEVASGKKSVRRSREDITVFKSVGCALEDLVTAELLTST